MSFQHWSRLPLVAGHLIGQSAQPLNNVLPFHLSIHTAQTSMCDWYRRRGRVLTCDLTWWMWCKWNVQRWLGPKAQRRWVLRVTLQSIGLQNASRQLGWGVEWFFLVHEVRFPPEGHDRTGGACRSTLWILIFNTWHGSNNYVHPSLKIMQF